MQSRRGEGGEGKEGWTEGEKEYVQENVRESLRGRNGEREQARS
jgi:hypothetical protein